MYIQRFRNCEGCFMPVRKRLANLRSKDDYECYGESYVKCFWGLCDRQTETVAFAVKPDQKVVTHQPRRQAMSLTNSSPLIKKH